MSTHQPNDPVLQITQSILTEAAQRPWLAALLMRRRPDWLTRLAQLAQRIRQLPQHTRRTLRRKLTSGLAAAALLLALAGPLPTVYAASIAVNGDGTGGTCSLADAITSANADTATGNCPAGSGADTITLAVDVNLAVALPDITTAITIEGGGHTIAGNNTFGILNIQSGSVTLNQATVTGGHGWDRGGIFNKGTLTVTNSTLSGNTATWGSGIDNSGGTVTVQNSTLSANSASSGGGGILNTGTLTVTNSTLSGNTATWGSGIDNVGGTVTVQNSTISGNSASSGDGAIYNNSTLKVQNSIVALQTSGADCYNYGSKGGTITSLGYNIESATSCGFAGTGDQQSKNAAALNLGTLANNGSQPHPFTQALGTGSVAIDKIPIGTNGCGTTVTTDERGAQRAGGGVHGGSACDVGAYEVSDQTPTAVTLTDFTATPNAPTGLVGLIGVAAALGVTWSLLRPRKAQ